VRLFAGLGTVLALLVVAGALVAALIGRGNDPADESQAGPDRKPRTAIVLAAGDIAYCGSGADDRTARLLGRERGTVLSLGDHAYPAGTPQQFERCYGTSWGRFKDRTRPAPGNHEYDASRSAEGYFGYFGAAAQPPGGYYGFDLGGWHLIALNSVLCDTEGCGPGSDQFEWLRGDLADNSADCTLAYWHHPRYTSGVVHGGDEDVAPLWRLLYESGAEIVLNGHEHNYERFEPQNPSGGPDPDRGIRQFVVGTGGGGHYRLGSPLPTSEARNADSYGVLKLRLRAGGYDWRFLPAAEGGFRDSGSGRCH
jgi:acid phosphatase type 7